jgi:gamma-glutamyltranspeptidase/glutathione hydrolase
MAKSPEHPNSVAPRRRPVTNMAPTMVFRRGAPVIALGSPGFHRIVSAQVQMLVNLLAHGMTPEAAIAAPRVHFEQGQAFIEGKNRPSNDPYFGGIHAIHFGPRGPVGLADPRREGVAMTV